MNSMNTLLHCITNFTNKTQFQYHSIFCQKNQNKPRRFESKMSFDVNIGKKRSIRFYNGSVVLIQQNYALNSWYDNFGKFVITYRDTNNTPVLSELLFQTM